MDSFKPMETSSAITEHKNRRHRVLKFRNMLRNKIDLPLQEQCKFLINTGEISIASLASMVDLTENDIRYLLEGKEYPYIRSNWFRYLHEPEDHAVPADTRKYKYKRKNR